MNEQEPKYETSPAPARFGGANESISSVEAEHFFESFSSNGTDHRSAHMELTKDSSVPNESIVISDRALNTSTPVPEEISVFEGIPIISEAVPLPTEVVERLHLTPDGPSGGERRSTGSIDLPPSPRPVVDAEVVDAALCALVGMGFDFDTASSTLFATNYNVNDAIDMLLVLR